MINQQNTNKHEWDLEERSTKLAKKVIILCKEIPRNPINDRITGQLVGSAGSIGANYREANDSLGKKDFLHRLRIARKEAKEAIHWLECLEVANPEDNYKSTFIELIGETKELKNILSSIISKTQ